MASQFSHRQDQVATEMEHTIALLRQDPHGTSVKPNDPLPLALLHCRRRCLLMLVEGPLD